MCVCVCVSLSLFTSTHAAENKKRSGEDRAAENKEFQSTVNDQRMTVSVLNKALDRLKQFYDSRRPSRE